MSRLTARLVMAPMLLHGIAARRLSRRPPHVPLRRILIAHHLLLGDTLMLAPLLAKLRAHHPHADIVMTCPKAIAPLFAKNPYGIRAIDYDPRDAKTVWRLWSERGFDLAISPADNRNSWLARALGSRHTVGFKGDRPAYKSWFIDEARDYPQTPQALPEIFASLVDGAAPPPYAVDDWPLAAPRPFDLPSADYAVLHLGASSPLKLWSAERWTALAHWLSDKGITPVWSAGAKEMQLVTQSDALARYPSFAGKLDLLQLAHLIKSARLLVCPDTGVAHLGRVVGTPTLTLFGPGSSLLCGKGEFWQNSRYLALSEDIACRNQDVLFKRRIDWVVRCGRGYGPGAEQCARPLCMEALSVARVQAAADSLLNAP